MSGKTALLVLVGVVAAFVFPGAFAQGLAGYEAMCSVPGYPTQHHQASAASCCEALRTLPAGVDWDTATVTEDAGPPGGLFKCDLTWSGGTDVATGNWSPCADRDTCVNPFQNCAQVAGKFFLASASDKPDSFTPPLQGCFAGCDAYYREKQPWKRLGPPGHRDWLAQYKYSGLECEQAPPPIEVPETPGEQCSSAGGVSWCESPQTGPGCGFVNDTYTCLGSAGRDKCFVNEDGSRLCAEGAATPPVPDNGTPGVPAAPDGQISTVDPATTVVNNYNYYNSGTVGGSSRDPNTGQQPTQGHGGNGSAHGEGEQEQEGEDQECEGERCSFGGPELEEGDTFGAIGSAFIAEASATPIMSALTGISANVGAGECPTATFEVFGVQQTLDPMCDVWPSIAGVLSAVMLVIYGLGGVRILFSA